MFKNILLSIGFLSAINGTSFAQSQNDIVCGLSRTYPTCAVTPTANQNKLVVRINQPGSVSGICGFSMQPATANQQADMRKIVAGANIALGTGLSGNVNQSLIAVKFAGQGAFSTSMTLTPKSGSLAQLFNQSIGQGSINVRAHGCN